MPYPAIIREDEQIQRPRARHYAQNERLWYNNSKLDASIKSLRPQEAGIGETEGMEDTRRPRPSQPTEQKSYELTKSEAASTGLTQLTPGSLHI